MEVSALEPMTEEQLNDLLGEEMYLGTLDLRGNKFDLNRDYSKKKNKDSLFMGEGKHYLNRTSVLENFFLDSFHIGCEYRSDAIQTPSKARGQQVRSRTFYLVNQKR